MPRLASCRLIVFAVVILVLGFPTFAPAQKDAGSIVKNFPISERTKLEFRAEFFNVFNHPNLQFAKSGPHNSINTTTFGTPEFRFLTAARDPRQIQFALKLSF